MCRYVKVQFTQHKTDEKKHEIEQKSMAKERKEEEEKMISERTAIAIKYTKCSWKKNMKKEDNIWLHKKDSIYTHVFTKNFSENEIEKY